MRLRVYRSQSVDECAEDKNSKRKIVFRDIAQYLQECPFYRGSKVIENLALIGES